MLRRRWFLTVAVVVLAALVAVWAAGPVAAWVLESRLRDAGWREAAVVGSSLSFNEMAFERIMLIADGALIAEDVRARLGPGVEQVSIGRLRVRAALTVDGEFIVLGAPGFSEGASAGAALPFHFMPPDGVTVEHAELLLAEALVAADRLVGIAAAVLAEHLGGLAGDQDRRATRYT